MKPLFVSLISLLLTSGVMPALAQDDSSKTALQSANRDVQTAQTQLHQERKNYLNAVQTSGKDSPQALAAKTRMDAAHEAWRGKMANRQTVRRQARHELMHRRDVHRTRTVTP